MPKTTASDKRKTTATRAAEPPARRSAARSPSAAALARIVAELEAIESDSGDGTVQLGGGNSLKVSSLDKIFFPKPKVTKGEVMRYYTTLGRASCRERV